jgi:hypothetical protein
MWVSHQLDDHEMTVETLARKSHLASSHLHQALEGQAILGLRQWFAVAAALERDVVEFIREVGLLSDAGSAYIPYCRDHSEAPLGDLWSATKNLPQTDRVVLLEYVYSRRREQW